MPQCCSNIAEKMSAFLDNWEANEKRNLFASVLSGLFVSIYILKSVKKYSSTFFIVGFCHLLLACYTISFLFKSRNLPDQSGFGASVTAKITHLG